MLSFFTYPDCLFGVFGILFLTSYRSRMLHLAQRVVIDRRHSDRTLRVAIFTFTINILLFVSTFFIQIFLRVFCQSVLKRDNFGLAVVLPGCGVSLPILWRHEVTGQVRSCILLHHLLVCIRTLLRKLFLQGCRHVHVLW